MASPNSKLIKSHSNSGSTASRNSSMSSCDNGHFLTTGTVTVTTSTSNPQRIRSHTTGDVHAFNPHENSGVLRSTTLGSTTSSGGSHHLWNVDLTDLSYLTHMQRVRARASFARQMSNSSERNRRRESIAAVNFPVHLTSAGSGLNIHSTSSNENSSNLVRMRNSMMGQSAPSLSPTMKESNGLRRIQRCSTSRKSLIHPSTSPTFPRSPLPLQNSPLDSPRNISPFHHFTFMSNANNKKASILDGGRRWSVASLPSSGYCTNTPGSSSVSLITCEKNSCCSSNDSNSGQEEESQNHSNLKRPAILRPRSRSLSSPIRSPTIENEKILVNSIYKERFPKATQQMEEKLQDFIDEQLKIEFDREIASDAVFRFAHHQVVELAKDCYHKSKDKLITSQYFCEMIENLEKLIAECREKSQASLVHLSILIRKVLVIISRPARLLECLEFDPEEFYRFLEVAEGEAKISKNIKTSIPQYIIGKLGLTQDPLSDISPTIIDPQIFSERRNSNRANNDLEDLDESKELEEKIASKPPSEDDFEIIKLISNGYYDRESQQFTDKQVFGTPEYLAPEVILKQGYAKTVDWWSLGVILYEFLIGCVPFFGETPEELFAHVINDSIEWPDEEDWPLTDESKDIITQLLEHNPFDRLGAGGSQEVKLHPFFDEIDWDSLLRQKAEFVPQLDGEDDTSYFDTRLDRYNHEGGDDSDDHDTDDSSLFGSFSSCSPRYHRVYSRVEKDSDLIDGRLRSSTSSSSLKDVTSPHSPNGDPINKADLLISRSLSVTEDRLTISSQAYSNKAEHNCNSLDNNSLEKSNSDLILKLPHTQHSTPKQTIICNHGTIGNTKLSPLSKSTDSSSSLNVESDSKLKQHLMLPKFSFSVDDSSENKNNTYEGNNAIQETLLDTCHSADCINTSLPSKVTIPTISTKQAQSKSRAVIKSASASGLSLIIPNDESATIKPVVSSGGSATSSRDTSPNRDMNTISVQLKPPIILRKGPRGFGFSLKAIRVYYGESDYYTVNHLVQTVKCNSPAFEAGLRPGDLITHINGESIQGLLHHQVLQLMLSGGDLINIRTTPLENTTIKSGGRKRNPNTSKMAKRPQNSQPNKLHRNVKANIKRSDSDKRRRSSLLRRLSSKRVSADMHQLLPHNASLPPQSTPPTSPLSSNHPKLLNMNQITPSRSYQSFAKAASADSSTPNSSTPIIGQKNVGQVSAKSSGHLTVLSTGCISRFVPSSSNVIQNMLNDASNGVSSIESSPANSVPNSPASSTRPSSLDGLKFKLKQTFRTPRRKSCGHIPLSPLARSNGGASPVLVTSNNSHLLTSTSPTSRSPSPLALSNIPLNSNGSQLIATSSNQLMSKHHRLAPIVQTNSNSILTKKLNSRPKSVIMEKCLNQKHCDNDNIQEESNNAARLSSIEIHKNFCLSKSKRESLASVISSSQIPNAVQPTIKVESTNSLTERPESSASVDEEICLPSTDSKRSSLNVDTYLDKESNRVNRSSSDPSSKEQISRSYLSRNKSLQSVHRK
ncbi:hypothetical protein RDWZM_002534 [Blomia tropicalis]|uniref:non-specific serine/threonine protein kinase n=1 Tax=Blomia tropicalis TaxID=40697 RepID=A0A9Q0RRM8_BLOTA|nr:hypothetical protein RDWZM_002534 [Blomia tropicalis]